MRSNSFRKLIYDNNGFYINKEDIGYFEIWYEWEFINGYQEQKNEKWVNNIYNEKFRPVQKTEYDNLFLSGAHTKTSINIWSMEGAVESGKITANYILDKYNKPNIEHYKHDAPSYIKLIQYIDNRYPDKRPITVLFSIFLIFVYFYGVYFLFIHII